MLFTYLAHSKQCTLHTHLHGCVNEFHIDEAGLAKEGEPELWNFYSHDLCIGMCVKFR